MAKKKLTPKQKITNIGVITVAAVLAATSLAPLFMNVFSKDKGSDDIISETGSDITTSETVASDIVDGSETVADSETVAGSETAAGTEITEVVSNITPPISGEIATSETSAEIETVYTTITTTIITTEKIDVTAPMEINPADYDGDLYVLGAYYASATQDVTIVLPDGWTVTKKDSVLSVQSSKNDKISFQINTNFVYKSSAEVEQEFAAYDFKTESTDYYLIDSEPCMRVDAIDKSIQWSNIYIPNKKIYISAIGTDWTTMNAIIQSIRIRNR